MRFFRRIGLRLRSLFRRDHVERELSDELRFHLEKLTDQNIASGMKPPQARAAARRELGGVAQIEEECRDTRGLIFIDTTLQDLRYGVRMLVKNPGFTVVVVLTLALGIGANTAIFSVVDGVLLRPLPFASPTRLVAVLEKEVHLNVDAADSYLNFLDWQRSAKVFEGIAAVRWQQYDLSSPGTPEHINGKEVSGGFFTGLGVKLSLGRNFTPADDRRSAAPVTIISDRMWRKRFAGNPDAIGKTVQLNGIDYAIVGVLPRDFRFWDGVDDVYTPLGQSNSPDLEGRGEHNLLCIARLKPGTTIAEAQAEMSTIQARIDQANPDSDRGLGVDVMPLMKWRVGEIGETLFLLLGAVGLVLLIACANVADLLLARFAARAREFAVRSALGAGRARVIRQLLTESVLLSLAGAALGLAISDLGLRAFLSIVPGSLPRAHEVSVNIPVLVFTFGVAIGVGILFGLVPARSTSKIDLEQALKQGGRTMLGVHRNSQSSLVVSQMALALILLVGAGLLFRTILRMWETDPGFQVEHLITFKVGLSPALAKTPSSIRNSYQQLLDRIKGIPGVEAASFTMQVPLNQQTDTIPFWINSLKPGVIQSAPRTLWFLTGPDYLRTMRIPLLAGRYFTPEDTSQSPCVVAIDSNFAHEYFPGRNPLGQTLSVGFQLEQAVGPCRIIGVVGHVRDWGLGNPNSYAESESYLAFSQDSDKWVASNYLGSTIVVRTPLEAADLTLQVKKAIYEVGPGQPVYDVQTMQEIVSRSMSPQRFPMILLGVFAALALLLACAGVYGVISYWVNQRENELGIRMALGAQESDVLRMIIGQGLRLIVIGAGVGIAGALMLTRFLAALLYAIKPTDPPTYIAASLILITVALLACLVPAWRATKVDPMTALRHE